METRRALKLDNLNRPVLGTEQCIELLLEGKEIKDVIVEDNDEVSLYDRAAGCFGTECLEKPVDMGFLEFNALRASQWLIPDSYRDLDVKPILLSRCQNTAQTDRVEMEYAIFEKNDLIPVLRCLIFMVGKFRENKYVWGVGRGSSVSSYCLYLLGVHKIDSIKYGLSIKEFLKDE